MVGCLYKHCVVGGGFLYYIICNFVLKINKSPPSLLLSLAVYIPNSYSQYLLLSAGSASFLPSFLPSIGISVSYLPSLRNPRIGPSAGPLWFARWWSRATTRGKARWREGRPGTGSIGRCGRPECSFSAEKTARKSVAAAMAAPWSESKSPTAPPTTRFSYLLAPLSVLRNCLHLYPFELFVLLLFASFVLWVWGAVPVICSWHLGRPLQVLMN